MYEPKVKVPDIISMPQKYKIPTINMDIQVAVALKKDGTKIENFKDS
jgi:hypothetical protein